MKMLEENHFKEGASQEVYLPWNKETCLLFIQFCYFGNFPLDVLVELGNNGFPIAVELGLLSTEYFVSFFTF